ncbi:hypothetical protein CFK37_01160 [Virgibacillus phasianinus]|uniref:Flagellar protein n=1 Tax=Virgibacillus phasianinus TaxID=2017483 RepID=A0A220TYX8_9BACI|nr:hypothetical protein [Virgibacillus phasianinus]ASK60916.1 hypothetical protein CFK37_01160 [Virgibacillus phasianinus]
MGELVRNCRLCQKQMESSPFTMCSKCLTESNRVQSFVAKHPHVSIERISNETEVPYDKVEQMVMLGLNEKDTMESQAKSS